MIFSLKQNLFIGCFALYSVFLSVAYAETTSQLLKNLVYFPTHQLNAKSVAIQKSTITPQIAAHIKSVSVQLGSQVKKNDLLATLDCTTHEKNLAISKAQKTKIQGQLELQQKQIKRQLKLLKTQSLSQIEVDQTESNIIIFKANLEEQNERIKSLIYTISLCEISAPFDGVIIEKQAELGQSASPNAPLFSLLNTKKIHVQANIPQHLLAEYNKAKELSFIDNKQSYSLKKDFILPQFSQNRTIEARLKLKSKETLLMGLSGRLQWSSSTPYLPSKYLRRRQNDLGVYIIRDNFVVFHVIKEAQEGRDNPINLPLDAAIITDKNILNVGERVK